MSRRELIGEQFLAEKVCSIKIGVLHSVCRQERKLKKPKILRWVTWKSKEWSKRGTNVVPFNFLISFFAGCEIDRWLINRFRESESLGGLLSWHKFPVSLYNGTPGRPSPVLLGGRRLQMVPVGTMNRPQTFTNPEQRSSLRMVRSFFFNFGFRPARFRSHHW